MFCHLQWGHRIGLSLLSWTWVLAGAIWGQSGASSVESAIELSKATGRPIFVMAGRET
jgi:hypothetical protein